MSEIVRRKRVRSRTHGLTLAAKSAAIGSAMLLLASCASTGEVQSSSSEGLDLKLGTILPQTGSLSALGPAEIAAVELAAQDINDADAGVTVTVENEDSGDTTTDLASQAATSLIANGVGAIVGSISSSVTMSVIDQVTQAEVAMIAPASTSPTLSEYDDDGFFWRTAPSDVMQGSVMGSKLIEDGKTNVVIIYMNDSYGIGLNDAVVEALDLGAVAVTSVSYDPNATNFTAEVNEALEVDPDAVVVIGFDEAKSVFSALLTSGYDFENVYTTDGVSVSSDDPIDVSGMQSTASGVNATDDFRNRLTALDGYSDLSVFSYAAESYDAAILSALAALQGEGTDGTTIRDNLQSVSAEGTACDNFADCAALISQGEDIDYNGISGGIDFDSNGDVSTATITVYRYGADNVTSLEDEIEGSL